MEKESNLHYDMPTKKYETNLKLSQERQKFLEEERKNHFGMTPAYRILGELAKVLPPEFTLKSIKFKPGLPVKKMQNLNVAIVTIDDYNIKISSEEFEFSAIFSNEEKERYNNIEIDISEIGHLRVKKENIINQEEIGPIIPQKGNLIMIDNILEIKEINSGDKNYDELVADRTVKDKDFEGENKFNKFRFIEMVGQAGSYHFLREINKGLEGNNKQAAIFKDINVQYFDESDYIKRGDILIIKIIQNSDEKSTKRQDGKAQAIVAKVDGTIVFRCSFFYKNPRKILSYLRAQEMAERKKINI